MDQYMRVVLLLLLLVGGKLPSEAADTVTYWPDIHATIRAKYEYQPTIGKGRFEIRNARVSLEGKMHSFIGYKAEIDLSDEGEIKMLDAYIRFQLPKRLKFTIGQMRVPFTIDAHRSPHLQYFANRSFIAKQVGNVRDVGAAVGYIFSGDCPLTLEAGIFNGSGLTDQKNFWTSDYNFSFKAQAMITRRLNMTVSFQQTDVAGTPIGMYDIGGYYESNRWHIEGEYLRKNYTHGKFPDVNAADVFVAYRLPLKKTFSALSFLGRYDYMSDHSKGKPDENGQLTMDDPERHRLTGGMTLSLGTLKFQADIRINYEQYFYNSGTHPLISERNKAVIEFVCRF